MGRILVVQRGGSLGDIVERLVGAKHEVTAIADERSALTRIAAGLRFDAIVCDLADDGAAFRDEVSKVDIEQARRMLVLVSDPIADPSDRCLVKPFQLGELADAIESMLGG